MSDWQLFFEKFSYVTYGPYDDNQLPEPSKEIWIKGTFVCNEQVTDYDSGIDVSIYNDDHTNELPYGLYIILTNAGNTGICICGGNYNEESNHFLVPNSTLSFVIHLFSDANNGIFEIFWSDGSKDTIVGGNGNVNDGDYFEHLVLNNFSNKVFMSNVTVSTQELSFDVRIPITLNFDTARIVQNVALQEYCKVWLKFDDSPIDDAMGNSWEMYRQSYYDEELGKIVYPDPTVSSNFAVRGNALYGDGKSSVTLYDLLLGGQDFCIMGFAYLVSGTVFHIWNRNSAHYDGEFMNLSLYDSIVKLRINPYVTIGYSPAYIETSCSENSWFNFKVSYSHDDSTIYLYINNNLEGSYTLSRQIPRTEYTICVGAREVTTSNLVGTVDEFRIFDGVKQFDDSLSKIIPVLLKCDTSFNAYKRFTFYPDTQRRVTYNGVWRYENYGTANLLSIAGTTVTDLTKSQAIYKSAFYQPTRAKCFDIPATKEIWIKCDIFTTANYSSGNRIRIYSDDGNGVNGWCTQTPTTTKYQIWHNGTQLDGTNYLNSNKNRSFLLHMKSGVSDGIIEYFFANGDNQSFTGNVNNGNDFDNVYIQMDGSNIYVSDLIISNAQIDINEHTTFNAAFNADLLLAIIDVHQELFFHSLRNVVSSQQIQFPLCRHLISANDIVFDTFRNVLRTVDLDCDTVRTMPHKIFLSVIADTPNNLLANSADIIDVPEDNEDIQSFEISINEQQLTDVVTFSSVNHFNILEQVTGQFRDYKFNIRIESIQERGILSSCQCCSDIDEILYTQIDYKIPKNEQWHNTKSNTDTSVPSSVEIVQADKNKAKASTHVKYLAGVFGKQPVMQFDDFVSTVDVKAGGVTYNDLIRSIFGWTYRIPHKLINCYLRDDKLFIIQRGHENNVVDLTGTTLEIVSRDKSLIRTFWGSSTWSKTETREVYTPTIRAPGEAPGEAPDDDDDEPEPEPPQPDEQGNTRNSDGLLTKTEKTENGIRTVTEFSYDGDGSVVKTVETVYKVGGSGTLSKTTTEYSYTTIGGSNRKVLWKESVRVVENDELVDERITTHDYMSGSSGQVYVSTNNSDAEHLGNIAGESNGDVRQTPFATYTYEKENRSSRYGGLAAPSTTDKDPSQYTPQQRTIYGITPYDTSFPVHGVEDLVKITDAIKWLNRKTMEVVTINLFDFPHVIDFNDRILLEGNEYFLKSNTAIQNNRIVNKQTLSIVRWY